MKVSSHALGTVIETEDYFAFFGNKDAQVENLKKSFPQFTFKRIHQVHGDAITETTLQSEDFKIKADAHWTRDKNIALCISTADCTPALIYGKDFVAGIHAGWRGVENRIIPKTIEHLPSAPLKVLIGPHIQMDSFEVENNIRDQLLATIQKKSASYSSATTEGKSLVDLHAIVKAQIAEFNLLIWEEIKDTKTDLNYHSYRRDKEKSGRQQSFIALK